MRLIIFLLMAVIGGVMCMPAQSELIEISFSVTGSGFGDGAVADGVLVFDTEKAPDFVFQSSLVFLPESGALYTGTGKAQAGSPFSDDPGFAFDPTDLAFADLSYFPASDRFSLTIANASTDVFFTIDSPAGGFSAGMTSLPDTVADYAFAGGVGDFVSGTINVLMTGASSSASWSPTSGYSGRVWYNVRVVEPEASGCSPADMNADGQLDFFDISAFLTIYGLGCP